MTNNVKPKCDGLQSCNVLKVPTSELDINEVINVKNNCPIDGNLIKVVHVNYMVVKYTCQGKSRGAVGYCPLIILLDFD